MKKHYFEEVIEICKARNYFLLSSKEDYKNCSSEMQYVCSKHKEKGIMITTLGRLLEGKGCYYCGRERTIASRKVSIDHEGDRLLSESKDFTYINTRREIQKDSSSKIVIDFICNKHEELGLQTMVKNNMKRDIKGCKYCSSKYLPEWYVLQKKDAVLPHIELLSEYKNLTSPMNYHCEKHDHYGRTTVQNILNGRCCYYCGNEKLSEQSYLTDVEVEKVLLKTNPHIKLIDYKGAVDRSSKWLCKKHNEVFEKCFDNIKYNNSGCSKCYVERIRETQGMGVDLFQKRLNEIHPSLEVRGEYINNSTPIEIYCNQHKYSYYLTPAAALSRITCCDRTRKTYREEQVYLLLCRWGYEVETQKTFDDCKDKRKLAFDFYLKDFNILVEYDGEQHFRPVSFGAQTNEDAINRYKYTVFHDDIKNKYCKLNNIPLIRIPYWEFEELEVFLFDKLVKYGAIEFLSA